jgi:hypothetical protein
MMRVADIAEGLNGFIACERLDSGAVSLVWRQLCSRPLRRFTPPPRRGAWRSLGGIYPCP